VPFVARRVPGGVQDRMPFMSNRSRPSECSEGRGALSSVLPAGEGLIPACVHRDRRVLPAHG
jgi:hypothetical protein